jgi:5'-phosphate synthase pdxT subunit
MASPTIGVLALQGDVREHCAHLEQCGVSVTTVKSVTDLNGVDGLVIPGGESTTMSILALKNNLLEPLREFRETNPVYGSCAGLIMLAEHITDGRSDQHTIGGLHITAQRNAFGRQIDSFETDLNIPVLGDVPFHAVFIRAPLVTDIADDVEVLARIPAEKSASGHEQIVAVRQGNLLATSFHPEITPDLRFHQYFVEMVRVA